jgi:peptidoglycan glycosyltransferase
VNTVWAQVGEKLGKDTMRKYMERLGFDAQPPIDLPSDELRASGEYLGGRLIKPTNPNVDVGRMAIGQDKLNATPLQMAMVASAVANNGVLMRPHVVKEVRSASGKLVARVHPQRYSQAMKPQTATALNDMMVKVVQAGTGTKAQIPGITVAGKTGTAETGRKHVYTAWFIFFAPAENPQVAGAVVVENQLNGFGGSVSAPIAKTIMEAILPPASKKK